ncbi:hypothetical protein B6U80_00305 [Candidatus Pacearchaeota archaeon ex4484_26]|nr:MAG: hypothetical protein B6U80_00305 [Candidatus Pacearchaeota archaeon ex4484_26]
MVKQKIAIAIDKALLDLIDVKVDSVFPSRSQAIEHFLRKGLQEELLKTAVLLLKGEHQEYSLKKIKGESLIESQISFLKGYDIKDIHIVTQKSKYFLTFMDEVEKVKKKEHLNIYVHEKDVKGNAQALFAIKQWLTENFIAMSADLQMQFNLRSMIKKHLDFGKPATIGLMMRDKPAQFGNAILDGDFVVDFIEKPKQVKSYAVNAGIYVFSPKIFSYIKKAASLEKDVFPKLAKARQLIGYFVKGKYRHMEE